MKPFDQYFIKVKVEKHLDQPLCKIEVEKPFDWCFNKIEVKMSFDRHSSKIESENPSDQRFDNIEVQKSFDLPFCFDQGGQDLWSTF